MKRFGGSTFAKGRSLGSRQADQFRHAALAGINQAKVNFKSRGE